MDCGDAGHILLSSMWPKTSNIIRGGSLSLHSLGECEVKHGQNVSVVNFYHDGQNSAVPEKFAGRNRKTAKIAAGSALCHPTLGHRNSYRHGRCCRPPQSRFSISAITANLSNFK